MKTIFGIPYMEIITTGDILVVIAIIVAVIFLGFFIASENDGDRK
jgi:hypothetical protein